MKKIIFNKLSLVLVSIFFINLCSSVPVMDQKDWKTNSYTINTEKNSFTITKFPSKSQSKKTILLLDPIFLNKEVLYPTLEPSTFTSGDKSGLSRYIITHEVENIKSHATLIPTFQSAGYTVLFIKCPDNLNPKGFASELNKILEEIEKKESSEEFILGGLSLGGQTLAHYLQLNQHSKIKKYFFLGTGFDYNHSGSLLYSLKTVPPGKDYYCNLREPDNLCNTMLTSLYLDKSKRNALNYPVKIPELEKDPINSFSGLSKSQTPILIIYGKLDSVSPEEAVLPPFFPGRKGATDKIFIFEASSANYLDFDYDHFDLFFHKNSQSDVHMKILRWIEKD